MNKLEESISKTIITDSNLKKKKINYFIDKDNVIVFNMGRIRTFYMT